jgi:hypothetical protein
VDEGDSWRGHDEIEEKDELRHLRFQQRVEDDCYQIHIPIKLPWLY